MQFVVRMTTAKGEFWWDGASLYDRQAAATTGDVFRSWGWLDRAALAQRFRTRGNGLRAAQRLYTELERLYLVRIEVVGIEVTTLGVKLVETEVTGVGDCLRGEGQRE